MGQAALELLARARREIARERVERWFFPAALTASGLVILSSLLPRLGVSPPTLFVLIGGLLLPFLLAAFLLRLPVDRLTSAVRAGRWLGERSIFLGLEAQSASSSRYLALAHARLERLARSYLARKPRGRPPRLSTWLALLAFLPALLALPATTLDEPTAPAPSDPVRSRELMRLRSAAAEVRRVPREHREAWQATRELLEREKVSQAAAERARQLLDRIEADRAERRRLARALDRQLASDEAGPSEGAAGEALEQLAREVERSERDGLDAGQRGKLEELAATAEDAGAASLASDLRSAAGGTGASRARLARRLLGLASELSGDERREAVALAMGGERGASAGGGTEATPDPNRPEDPRTVPEGQADGPAFGASVARDDRDRLILKRYFARN